MGAVVSCIRSIFRAIGNALMSVVNGIAYILKAIINGVANVFNILISCVTCGRAGRSHVGGGIGRRHVVSRPVA
ncbi:hypothetical protein EV426DRAFT_335096 [Tirmania nivea]|nr:hypothetical protein EV426DRAFT_335096 [Tirmania nivea]